jgi:hypothetical protein
MGYKCLANLISHFESESLGPIYVRSYLLRTFAWSYVFFNVMGGPIAQFI